MRVLSGETHRSPCPAVDARLGEASGNRASIFCHGGRMQHVVVLGFHDPRQERSPAAARRRRWPDEHERFLGVSEFEPCVRRQRAACPGGARFQLAQEGERAPWVALRDKSEFCPPKTIMEPYMRTSLWWKVVIVIVIGMATVIVVRHTIGVPPTKGDRWPGHGRCCPGAPPRRWLASAGSQRGGVYLQSVHSQIFSAVLFLIGLY